MTATLDQYKTKSVWLIGKLIADFKLTDFQAAGICGNGYQESMLQPVLENDGIVTTPTRGIGWFQWTGPRHTAFVNFCSGANLDWHTDDAEYGFLKHELQTDHAFVLGHLRPTTTLADATAVFEKFYEGAGVVQMAHRLTGAQIALDAWHAQQSAAAAVASSTAPAGAIQPQGSG
jgi:hypothetical protein